MAAFVLAIEPDPNQATLLRQIIGTRTKAGVTVVESRDAAIDALGEAVPDLILLTALLSPGDEEALIRHLRTLPQATYVQTLTIPRLRAAGGTTKARFFSRKRRKTSSAGCDPAVFAREVDQYLRRAHELRREAADRQARVAEHGRSPVAAPTRPVDRDCDHASNVASGAHKGGSDDPWQWRPGEPSMVDPAPAEATSPVSSLATTVDEHRCAAEAKRAEAEARLGIELERVRSEADEQRRAELNQLRAEADALREQAVAAARIKSEQELAQVRMEAEERLSAELDKARDDAARARREELDRVKAEAEALRDSATREAREAAQRTAAAELASVRDEAEQLLSDELTRVRVESAQMLDVELRKARIEADEARLSELTRVQEEADALKLSAEHEISEAQRSAAELLEGEVERVRAEAEARISAERAKADREASESTLAELTEARARGDELREVAVREAQSVAEAAARQALETEIARVRSEADEKLSEQLDEIRAESDQRRAAELADLQAQIGDLRRMAEQAATPTPAPTVPSRVSPGTPAATSPGPRRRTVAVFGATTTEHPKSGPSTSPSVRHGAGEEIQAIAEELAPESPPSTTKRADYYSLWQVQTRPSPTSEKAASQPPPARSRVRRWLATAAASLLVMLIDGFGFGLDMGGVVTEPIVSAPPADALPRTSLPATAEVEAVTSVGRLEIHSIPARARVAVDGETRGSTPLLLDVAPGRHEVVVSSSAGTIRRTPTVRENRTVTIYETISPGWIAVFSRIKLDIAIDGRQVGTTEDGHLLVPPGRHDAVLANRRLGFRERHTFDVEPGEVTAHTVVLPSTSVRFVGIAGTEIHVDGESIGVLPLASVELPIGTRELVKRFPDGTEARERIELGIGAPTTIAVDARPASPAPDRRGALTVFPPGHR